MRLHPPTGRGWRGLLSALLGLSALAAQAAPPQITTIEGDPLTIRVGDDTSFQILNSEVPGFGQFYPSGGEGTADLGWFVRVGDTLYAPRFEEHPDGSATSNLGDYVPLTPVSISAVSGAGSEQDPYRVTVVNDLGATGLRATLQVSYTNGRNYLIKALTLRNTGAVPQPVKIFYGGDIFLADDDDGVPYVVENTGSPGGSNCPDGSTDYHILLIPQTPADAYAAHGYSTVWGLIGDGELGNSRADDCRDNGAALQWNRTVDPGTTAVIQVANSFGMIPAIAQFNVTEVTPNSAAAGQSVAVTITGYGFHEGSTFDFGDGITVSDLVIVNNTTATATLTIDADTATGPRDVDGREHAEGAHATLRDGFTVLEPGAQPSGQLQFGATSYSVREDAGTLTVTVRRLNGSSGAASIDYAVAAGTAAAGADYVVTGGTLHWADGEDGNRTFTVAIVDDQVIENSETFTLNLANATGAQAGTPISVQITILDDDQPAPPSGGGKIESGGAAGGALLLGLGLAAALRRARAALPAVAVIAALGMCGVADAGDWYAGVRAGVTQVSNDSAELSRKLRQRGHAVDARVDDSDYGTVLYLGYRVNPLLSVEAGYQQLLEHTATFSGTASSVQSLSNDAAKLLGGNGDALQLGLRLDLPVYGPLTLVPRFGAYLWTSKTEVRWGELRADTRERGLGVHAGLALMVALGESWQLGIGSEALRGGNHGVYKLHGLQLEYVF